MGRSLRTERLKKFFIQGTKVTGRYSLANKLHPNDTAPEGFLSTVRAQSVSRSSQSQIQRGGYSIGVGFSSVTKSKRNKKRLRDAQVVVAQTSTGVTFTPALNITKQALGVPDLQYSIHRINSSLVPSSQVIQLGYLQQDIICGLLLPFLLQT